MGKTGGLMPIPRIVRKVGTIERKSVLKYRSGELTSAFLDAPPIPTPRPSGLKQANRYGGVMNRIYPQYLRRVQAD